jgi:hypothetical protein
MNAMQKCLALRMEIDCELEREIDFEWQVLYINWLECKQYSCTYYFHIDKLLIGYRAEPWTRPVAEQPFQTNNPDNR